MKLIKYLIYFFIFQFTFLNVVSALTYQCEYDFDNQVPGALDHKYIFEFDNTNGNIKFLSEKEDYFVFISWQHFYYDYHFKFSNNEAKTYADNVCPVLYLAYNMDENWNATKIYNSLYFYSDAHLRENGGHGCISNVDPMSCIGNLFSLSFTNFYTGVLKEDSEINKNKTMVDKCNSLSVLIENLDDNYGRLKDCDDTCSSIKQSINMDTEKIKKFCNSILTYSDVIYETESGIIDNKCVDECLHFQDTIVQIKNKHDIENVGQNQVCGFSERLIHWIANIIRWVKYIIPVAVIVLGILDFIKAMSADKEDEMKKAQQRFIRRLIAAALIFIVPFIIEFILNKLGFGANGCGIINL